MWFLFRRKPRQTKSVHRTPPSYRPRLEVLEHRCLLSAGSLDPTFGNGGVIASSPISEYALAVAVQPSDQKIDVVGRATDPKSGSQDFAITRYNPDGTLDKTFGNGGTVLTPIGRNGAIPDAIAIQPNGDIVVAGQLGGAYNSKNRDYDSLFALVRYTPTGSLDTTFGNRGIVTTNTSAGWNEGINALALQSNGDIVAAGEGNSSTGGHMDVARYTPNGKLDASFGSGGIEIINSFLGSAAAVALQPSDGKIVLAGNKGFSGSAIVALVRLNTNGGLDPTFGNGGTEFASLGTNGGSSSAQSLLVQPDGKLVIAGDSVSSTVSPFITSLVLARFNPDGSPDTTFGSGGNVISTAMSLGGNGASVVEQADGKLVVAGGRNGFTLERFTTTGQLDPTYGNGGTVYYDNSTINDDPRAAAIQANGDVVVVGTVYGVARFLPSEPQIGSFTPSPNPVTAGSNVTLTASSITDGNPNSTIAQVAFYLDSNGDGVLDAGDALLGDGSADGLGNWLLNVSTAGWSATDLVFAQAKDNYGVLSAPDPLTLTVQ